MVIGVPAQMGGGGEASGVAILTSLPINFCLRSLPRFNNKQKN